MILKTLAYLPVFTLAGSALAQTLANQGLVGYASLAADSVDFLGDSVRISTEAVHAENKVNTRELIVYHLVQYSPPQLGGIGSAAAIFPGTFKKNTDGTYSGRLIGAPDRGSSLGPLKSINDGI